MNGDEKFPVTNYAVLVPAASEVQDFMLALMDVGAIEVVG